MLYFHSSPLPPSILPDPALLLDLLQWAKLSQDELRLTEENYKTFDNSIITHIE